MFTDAEIHQLVTAAKAHRPLRLFVSGRKKFGADTLKLALGLGHQVVGVSSPRYGGRFSDYKDPGPPPADDAYPDRLRAVAQDAGVPWMPAGTLKVDTMPAGVDLILAAHSYDFIGRKTRNRAELGALGYHPSLLPLHRGRDAIRWTLKMKERITGGTVFWLSDNVDAGDVAAQDWCFVQPDETPESLWRQQLFPLGLRLFAKVLSDLQQGVVVRIPQDNKLATWEPGWERPPLYRPDLDMLPSTAFSERYTVVRERSTV
jgi:methionyl-tRNA formyltransferase